MDFFQDAFFMERVVQRAVQQAGVVVFLSRVSAFIRKGNVSEAHPRVGVDMLPDAMDDAVFGFLILS